VGFDARNFPDSWDSNSWVQKRISNPRYILRQKDFKQIFSEKIGISSTSFYNPTRRCKMATRRYLVSSMILVPLILGTLSFKAASASSPREPYEITIYTLSVGSTNYLFGVTLAELINEPRCTPKNASVGTRKAKKYTCFFLSLSTMEDGNREVERGEAIFRP
jgi:hypothetical protein